jgi:hypothetical protein
MSTKIVGKAARSRRPVTFGAAVLGKIAPGALILIVKVV